MRLSTSPEMFKAQPIPYAKPNVTLSTVFQLRCEREHNTYRAWHLHNFCMG